MEAAASLDPLASGSVYESLPLNQIFDGLVATDTSLNIAPGLAESWTISRDGTVYRFTLRANARFADGEPVTAGDVVFTFRRALDPNRERPPMAASYLSVLEDVRAVDPRTVEIRLSRPYVSFLGVLALDNLRIVPRHVIETLGERAFAREPVGSGPFRLGSWTTERMVLDANPVYWGPPSRVERVEIAFPDPADPERPARMMAAGDLDLLEPTPEALDLLAGRGEFVVYRYQELAGSFLGLSTAHPPLDDVRVRQAIAHAIDRTAIAAISPTTRRLAEGILPPGMPGYSPAPKALPHDPERSRRLLAEAGHPGGRGLRPVDLYIVRGTAATARTIDRIRSDLEAVGLEVRIHEVSWAEMSRRIDDNAAPAFLLGWIADLVDPDGFVRTLFEPEGSSNYFAFQNARVGELLRKATGELNPMERARLYRDLEVEILREAPVVPLFLPRGVVVHRRGVHGVEPGPLGVAALDLEKVWFETQGGGKH
jgi:peptide/nickel transport system substrate-binding protein/oligopeptide transport system substrate-binding protein